MQAICTKQESVVCFSWLSQTTALIALDKEKQHRFATETVLIPRQMSWWWQVSSSSCPKDGSAAGGSCNPRAEHCSLSSRLNQGAVTELLPVPAALLQATRGALRITGVRLTFSTSVVLAQEGKLAEDTRNHKVLFWCIPWGKSYWRNKWKAPNSGDGMRQSWGAALKALRPG